MMMSIWSVRGAFGICGAARWAHDCCRSSRRGALGLAALFILLLVGRPAPAQECAGDCNSDDLIGVNELITMVNIALGNAPVETCAPGDINADGQVTVNEIIRGIRAALESPVLEAAGTCAVPGTDAANPLPACAPGTPVKVYRCADRETCVSDKTKRRLAVETVVGSDGTFHIPRAADCLGTSTFLYVAEVAQAEETTVDFPPPYNPPSGRSADAGSEVRQVAISPLSEAAVRLADARGLANFGTETFADVVTAVNENTAPETYVGKDPGAAADAVTAAAEDNDNVKQVLATVLRHDQPVLTSLDAGKNQDFYKFSLNEPTTVLLQMTRSSGAIAPCIEVVGKLAKQCGADSVRVELTLPAGTYQVYVSDQGITGVGSYRLYYERLRPEDAVALPIVDSQTLDVGDLDVFTFNVTCESSVRLTATQQLATAQPCLELWKFDDAGATQVTTACDGHIVEQIDESSLEGGRYLVVVGAHTATDAGSYTLQLFEGNCGGPPTPTPTPAATLVYSNDFETSVGAEWQDGTTNLTVNGARRFLGGRFDIVGSYSNTLTLGQLPAHAKVTISFDLFLIGTWDGNSSAYGPDVYDVSVVGGQTLLHTTFSMFNGCYGSIFPQAFPDSYPGGSHPAFTGASEMETLGNYVDCEDFSAVYHLEFTFPHSEGSLMFRFSSSGGSKTGDESWGLDNVAVRVSGGAV